MRASDIAQLLNPAAYPGRPDGVELAQTHISYVFLAGDNVYKVKKPVNLGFLDFSTLERRHYYCGEEVRLNSRFCPGLYYGVEPLVRSPNGLRFGGKDGEVLDYAIHMRRLPRAGMMDELVAHDALSLDLVGRLVDRLARFYAQQASTALPAGHAVESFEQHWRECFSGGWQQRAAPRLDALRHEVDRAIARLHQQFLKREASGRIVDGHGDLRCESVCFGFPSSGDVCISDCIEFDPTLRIGDPALDIGFLAMDMEARGRRDLADLFVGLYLAASGDTGLPLVLDACKSYRALVRTRVEWLKSEDIQVTPADRSRAREASDHYLDLAEETVNRAAQPFLVLVYGASGTGKSVLAGALASRLGAVLVSTDLTRKRLFGYAPTTRVVEKFGAGIYALAASAKVYEAINVEAAHHLSAGHAVVIDGTFLLRSQRQGLTRVAEQIGGPTLLIECSAPEDVVRERQELRRGQEWRTTDGSYEIYARQLAVAEPVARVEGPSVVVDTTRPIASQLAFVLAKLRYPGQ